MNNEFNPALEGSPVKGYLSFAIPSVIALVAMAAAPIIDGLFIANYLGVEALAAVNLVIPVFTIAFGFAYMIGIGGSVSAGKFIGEKNKSAASDIYSKTVIIGVLYSLLFSLVGILGSEKIFSLLGAEPSLFPFMHDYFNTLLLFLPIEILSIVLYYYVRISGFPNLVTLAVVVGILSNIGLNYLFIAVLGFGLKGAAIATGLSAMIMIAIMLTYKFSPKAWLQFTLFHRKWRDMWHAIYNGLSDLIDEISGGFVTFILNLIVIGSLGAAGVAAFSVVSYSLFIGFLFFFGLSEALQVVASQCFGAKDVDRLKQFLKITLVIMMTSAVLFSSVLLVYGDMFIGFFIDSSETELIKTANEFIYFLWPIFIFNGLNVIISAYLTLIHQATASVTVSTLRALVFPLGLLYIITEYFPDIPFIIAITSGEVLASFIAVFLFLKFRPAKLFVS